MNVRGEQLEQHDILKAELMGYLNNNDEKEMFAKIWDACSDMSGYIQMHFITDLRTAIFGESWDEIPSNNSLKDYIEKERIANKNKDKDSKSELPETINDIIVRDCNIEDYDGVDDNDVRVRFESIIDFPYFLLHTLKLYIYLNSVKHKEQDKKIINELLDDKKLCDTFNNVIENGTTEEGKAIAGNEKDFASSFIVCLLRTRFLFDKYIIKREFAKDNVDGNWSLKRLKKEEEKNKSKSYYVNTDFGEEALNKTNVMIQSALRVSYTSPRIMHWITDLLIWLSKEDCQKINKNEMINYNKEAEHIAEKAVNEAFLGKNTDEIDSLGVKIPHIVFNYLDYLLWKNNKDKYKDFEFEFRNSVEHWYPQNPAEDKWEDVNTFGNLCIIQRNINSRFSNMAPEAKKSSYAKHIEKGSIKLRIMSDLTISEDGVNAKERWKSDVCKQHEKEMLKVLGFVDTNNKITLLNES